MANNTIATPIRAWAQLWASDREVLDVTEVATLLGLDPRTVTSGIDSGDLPGTRVGRKILVAPWGPARAHRRQGPSSMTRRPYGEGSVTPYSPSKGITRMTTAAVRGGVPPHRRRRVRAPDQTVIVPGS